MFWVWVGLALTAGLVGGFMAAAKLFAQITKEGLEEAARNRASDQDLLMRTFRRELANWFFKTDPDRYHALYERARIVEAGILKADPTERRELLTRIATDIPFIADFDLVGTREYILYADSLGPWDYVEERYLDIVRWQSLQKAGDPAWRFISNPTSEDDLKYLDRYTQRLKDTRFRKRLEETMRLYWFARGGDITREVDNDFFSVRYVHHIVENRYGIHLKDTNEFGLFSTFDDGDFHHESYYRSNADFSEETILDASITE